MPCCGLFLRAVCRILALPICFGVSPALLEYIVAKFAVGGAGANVVVLADVRNLRFGNDAVSNFVKFDTISLLQEAGIFGSLRWRESVREEVEMASADVVARSQFTPRARRGRPCGDERGDNDDREDRTEDFVVS